MLGIYITRQLNTCSDLVPNFKKNGINTPNTLHDIPGMVLN